MEEDGRKRRREDKVSATQRKNENEQKRRGQENIYLEELAEKLCLINPDLNNVSAVKPDKCAILEQTVHELRRINSEREAESGDAVIQQSQVSSSKQILANDILGPLLLEALDGFLFVVNRQGKVEFASEHITQHLKYSQDDLVGKSIYNIIHVGDHAQFSSSLLPMSLGDCIPWPTENPSNKSRTFNCRMLTKSSGDSSEGSGEVPLPQYENMQITAVLQPYPYDKDLDPGTQDPNDPQSCLVCLARKNFSDKVQPLQQEQFTTKQDLKGKILACDTSGVNPSEAYPEFIGNNIQEFVHINDLDQLHKHHGEVAKNGSNTSSVYRFKLHENRFVFVQTKSKLFKNPTKREAEFIMSTHSIVRECDTDSELKGSASTSLMKSIIGQTAAKNRDLRKPPLTGTKSASQALMGLSNQQGSIFGGMAGNHGNLTNLLASDTLLEPTPGPGSQELSDLLELLPDSEMEQILNFSSMNNNNFPSMDGGGAGNFHSNLGAPTSHPHHQPPSGLQNNMQGSWNNNMNNIGSHRMVNNTTNSLASLMGALNHQQQTPLSMLHRSNSHGGGQPSAHHAMAMKSPISPGFQQRSPGFANQQRSPGFTPSPGIPTQRSPAPQLSGAAGNYVRPPTPSTPSLMSPPPVNTSMPSPLQELQSMEAKAGVGIQNPQMLEKVRQMQSQKMMRQGREGRDKLRKLLMQSEGGPQHNPLNNNQFNKSFMGNMFPLSSPTSSSSTSTPFSLNNAQHLVRSNSSGHMRHSSISSISSNKSVTSEPRTPSISGGQPLESPHSSRPRHSPALSSPQQPQSTTPDSSSKDHNNSGSVSGSRTPEKSKDNILKQLLSADDEEDEISGDSQQQPATSTSNLGSMDKCENEAEPKNALLIKLLNESRHIDAEENKVGKNKNELIQRLLRMEDEEEDQKTPKAESTSNEDGESPQRGGLGLRLPTTSSSSQLSALGTLIRSSQSSGSSRSTPNPPATPTVSTANELLRIFSSGDLSLPGSPDKLDLKDHGSHKEDQLNSFLSILWDKQSDEASEDTNGNAGGGGGNNSNVGNCNVGHQLGKLNNSLKRKLSDNEVVDSTDCGLDFDPLSGGNRGPGNGIQTTGPGATPSQRNILLANLLSQTPVSEGLLQQKLTVDVCSTPQSKLPKRELLDKVLEMKEQHQLQMHQNRHNNTRKGPGRPPGSTNKNKENSGLHANVINKNLNSEKPNSWDNPRTNPNSPFPGNTKDHAKDLQQQQQHMNKDAGSVSSMGELFNVDNSNTVFNPASSSMDNSLSNSESLFSKLLDQADELHKEFNIDATTSNQGPSAIAQQLSLDQSMTEDSNLYSQLEQVLTQTESVFSQTELDSLLGGPFQSSSSSGNSPLDFLSEQMQIDLIQQQLMKEVGSPNLTGVGGEGMRSNELTGGPIRSTAHSLHSNLGYNTSQMSSMSSELPPNSGGIMVSSGMKLPLQHQQQQQQQQQRQQQQQLLSAGNLGHQLSQQQAGAVLGGGGGGISGSLGPRYAQLRQLQEQQRNMVAALPNQGNRFPGPQNMKPGQNPQQSNLGVSRAQQVRHTLLLRQQEKRMRAQNEQQHQQQRLLLQQQQQQQQRSFGGFPSGGQQNRFPQMPSPGIPDNFNEMMNTRMAPNVSLQRNQAPPPPMSPQFQPPRQMNPIQRGVDGGVVPQQQNRLSPFGPGNPGVVGGGGAAPPPPPQGPNTQWSQRANQAMMAGGAVAQSQQQQYGGMVARTRMGPSGPMQGNQMGQEGFGDIQAQYGPGGPSPQAGSQMMISQQQQQLRLMQARQLAMQQQGLHSPASQGSQPSPFTPGGHQDPLMSPHQKLSPNNQISPQQQQQQMNPGYSPSAGSLSSGSAGGGGLSPNFPPQHPGNQNHHPGGVGSLMQPPGQPPPPQGGNYNPMTSMGGYRPHTQQDLYNTSQHSQGTGHQKSGMPTSTVAGHSGITSKTVKQQLHDMIINTRSQQHNNQGNGGGGGLMGNPGGNNMFQQQQSLTGNHLSANAQHQQNLGVGDISMDFNSPNGELPMDVLASLNELTNSGGFDGPPSQDLVFKEEKTLNKVNEEAKQRLKQFQQMAYQQDQSSSLPMSSSSGDLAGNLFRNHLLSSPSTPASDSSLPDLITGRKSDPPSVVQTEPRPQMEEMKPPEQRNSLLQQLLSDSN